jgi:hypothetical protein
MTGEQTAIWVDESGQIATVWESDLRFYARRAKDLTEDEALVAWTQVVATGDRPATLVTVREHVGIAVAGKEASSLTWMEGDLSFQFVGPNHTVAQLSLLAEDIRSG